MPGFAMDFANMRQSVADRVLSRHRQHVQVEEAHAQTEKRELQELTCGAGRRPSLIRDDPDLDNDLSRPQSRKGHGRRSLCERDRPATRRQSMFEMAPRPQVIASRQYSEEVTYVSGIPSRPALLSGRRGSEPLVQEEGLLGDMRAALREADKLSRMRPEEEWQRVLDRTLPGRRGQQWTGVKGDRETQPDRKARPLGPRKEANLLLTSDRTAQGDALPPVSGQEEKEDLESDWPSHARPSPTPRPGHAPDHAHRMSRDNVVSSMSRSLPTYRSPSRRVVQVDTAEDGSQSDDPDAEMPRLEQRGSLPGKSRSDSQAALLRLDLGACSRESSRSNSADSRIVHVTGMEDENDDNFDEERERGTAEDEEEAEMTTGEDSATWREVKKCRYIRGYDPPEMVIPKEDAREFVFPKNDAK